MMLSNNIHRQILKRTYLKKHYHFFTGHIQTTAILLTKTLLFITFERARFDLLDTLLSRVERPRCRKSWVCDKILSSSMADTYISCRFWMRIILPNVISKSYPTKRSTGWTTAWNRYRLDADVDDYEMWGKFRLNGKNSKFFHYKEFTMSAARTSVATVQLSASVELSNVSLPVPKYQVTSASGLALTSQDSVTGSPMSADTWCESQVIRGMSDVTQNHITGSSSRLSKYVKCKFSINGSYNRLSLPFDAHCCHGYSYIKHPVPNRVKPSFVILDIRAPWRSVPIWKQWVSKG